MKELSAITYFIKSRISRIAVRVTGRKKSSEAYLKSVKGKYKGQRCFVLGNGPSLSPDDLNMLKDEITFASNRIYKIFDKQVWPQ